MAREFDISSCLRSLDPQEQCAVTVLLIQAMELLRLRELSSGQPIVDHAAAEEVVLVRSNLEHYASVWSLNGEAAACAVFDGLLRLECDEIVGKVGSDVVRAEREWQVGSGRVDRALWHQSGAMTLVEIKSQGDMRSVVGGIGQAVYYAAMAERTTVASEIRAALGVLGTNDCDIAAACKRAGVIYIPLGSAACHRMMSKIIDLSVFGAEEIANV